jgi:hypothetical protein
MAAAAPSKDAKTPAFAWEVDAKGVKIINNYINGKVVPPSTGKYMDVTSPHDGKVIARVAISAAAVRMDVGL